MHNQVTQHTSQNFPSTWAFWAQEVSELPIGGMQITK
jgi:hypothetical protein